MLRDGDARPAVLVPGAGPISHERERGPGLERDRREARRRRRCVDDRDRAPGRVRLNRALGRHLSPREGRLRDRPLWSHSGSRERRGVSCTTKYRRGHGSLRRNLRDGPARSPTRDGAGRDRRDDVDRRVRRGRRGLCGNQPVRWASRQSLTFKVISPR